MINVNINIVLMHQLCTYLRYICNPLSFLSHAQRYEDKCLFISYSSKLAFYTEPKETQIYL